MTTQIHFIDWVKSLEPTQQHLDIVLSQGYIQGVSVILCELIEQSTEPPILVSGTKKNQVYIYETSRYFIMQNKYDLNSIFALGFLHRLSFEKSI